MTDTTGARVRSLRALTGVSQLELAQHAELSDAYVSLIESGKRAASPKALAALAGALGTTVDFLLHGEDSPVEAQIRAAIEQARSQLTGGDPDAAEATFRGVDVSFVSHANRLAYLRAGGLVADAHGEIEASISWFERALDEARAVRSPRDVAEIGMWLVSAHHDFGNLATAVRLGEEILDEVEQLGIDGTDEHLRLAATLFWAIFERGDQLYALNRIVEFSDIAEQVGTARGRGSVLWNAALIMQETSHNDEEAIRLARVALEAMLEAGSSRDVPRLRYDFATILLKCETPRAREALEQLDLAEEALTRFGSTVEVARCLVVKGRAWMYLGELDEAETLVTRGLADLSATGTFNLSTCDGFTILGDLAAARGDLALATKRYGFAADRLSMMSASKIAGQVWATLGSRLAAIGDTAGAATAYRNALDVMHLPSAPPCPKLPASSQATGTQSLKRAGHPVVAA